MSIELVNGLQFVASPHIISATMVSFNHRSPTCLPVGSKSEITNINGRRHSFRPIHYVFFLQKINTQKSSVFISCIRIRNYKHKLESACFGRESDPRLALTSGLFAEIGTALNSGNKKNILTR